MSSQWRNTTLRPLIKLATGKLDVNASNDDGAFPFFTCARETFRIDVPAFDAKAVIVAGNGDLNVKYYEGKFNAYQRTYVLTSLNEAELLPRFLFLFMDSYIATLRNSTQGSTIKYLKKDQFTDAPIALPPLAEQRRIVDVIESVDAYIAALEKRAEIARTARSALLHDLLSNPGPDWTETKFGEVAQFVRGPFGGSLKKSIFVDAGYAVYEQQHAISGDLAEARYFIDQEKFDSMQRFHLLPKDIIMSCSGTVGRVAIAPEELARGVINQALLKVSANTSVNPHYLYTWMSSDWFQREIGANKGGGVQQNITSVAVLKKIPISVPPLAIQIEISEIADTTGNQIAALFAYSNKLRNLRSALLSDLLSGKHEIPASYDELLGAA